MLTRALFAITCAGLLLSAAPVTAQSDLDAFMARVMARRDDNWKKLQQYVLDEKERFDVTGPGGFPLWGLRREYTWFIRDGIFVRSPVIADGVKLSDTDRKKAEDAWIQRERRREANAKRRAEREAKGLPPEPTPAEVSISPTDVKVTTADDQAGAATITNTEDMLKQVREPQFVSSAYFLRFKFESGRYGLVGREKIGDVETLKIEYYPESGLFKEGRGGPIAACAMRIAASTKS